MADTSWGKMRYGWSKYGGAMYGLIKGESEWFCQGCGQIQPESVGQYMIPTNNTNREFVRVCAVCKHIQNVGKISYYSLIRIVRDKGYYG